MSESHPTGVMPDTKGDVLELRTLIGVHQVSPGVATLEHVVSAYIPADLAEAAARWLTDHPGQSAVMAFRPPAPSFPEIRAHLLADTRPRQLEAIYRAGPGNNLLLTVIRS